MQRRHGPVLQLPRAMVLQVLWALMLQVQRALMLQVQWALMLQVQRALLLQARRAPHCPQACRSTRVARRGPRFRRNVPCRPGWERWPRSPTARRKAVS
jgi:hypothetical protein